MIKAPGSTDVTITVYAHDKLTDAGKTGLVAASLNAYFSRVETDNDVTATAITESDLSALTDAHSDGGWYEIDATNMKGHYRLDLPDAVCASGAVEAVVSIQDAGDNNFIIMPTKIELKELDNLIVERATVNDVSATSTTFVSTLANANNNFYADMLIRFTSGNLAGQTKPVYSYIGASKTVVVDEAWVEAPGNGDSFIVLASHNHPITQIASYAGLGALTTQMTESYAANGVAPTLTQAVFAMHQMLMQFLISGTTITVKKLDNSTTAFEVTLDDATTPTSAVRT